MPLPLTSDQVAERIRNYPGENYLFISSLLRGLALAAACYSGFNISIDIENYWPSICPLFASFMVMMVSYVTWGRGILLTNSRSNLLDSILPFIICVLEVALFLVLFHPDKQIYTQIHHFWMLIFALHVLMAFILISNRIHNTHTKKDFESSLTDLVIRYKKWMKTDCKGTMGNFIVAIILWISIYFIWPLDETNFDCFQSVFAIGISIIFIGVTLQTEKQRQQIIEEIDKINENHMEV